MQPNTYYNSNPDNRLRALRRLLVAVLLVLLLAWGGIFIYRQVMFRVSKTDPNMNRVAAISPTIKIYFNKPINPSGLRLHYSSQFVTKSTVKEKEIDLAIQVRGLTVGKSYTIYLDYVQSKSGKEIRGKELHFTAKNIPLTELNQKEQQTIVNRQDKYPYQYQYINYVGFDNLIQQGLSTNQSDILKQDLFGYSNQVQQKYWTMTLLPKTLVVQIHNPDSASLDDIYSFQIKLGDQTLSARVTSDPIADQVQLQLLDASGVVVYNSANAHD